MRGTSDALVLKNMRLEPSLGDVEAQQEGLAFEMCINYTENFAMYISFTTENVRTIVLGHRHTTDVYQH